MLPLLVLGKAAIVRGILVGSREQCVLSRPETRVRRSPDLA